MSGPVTRAQLVAHPQPEHAFVTKPDRLPLASPPLPPPARPYPLSLPTLPAHIYKSFRAATARYSHEGLPPGPVPRLRHPSNRRRRRPSATGAGPLEGAGVRRGADPEPSLAGLVRVPPEAPAHPIQHEDASIPSRHAKLRLPASGSLSQLCRGARPGRALHRTGRPEVTHPLAGARPIGGTRPLVLRLVYRRRDSVARKEPASARGGRGTPGRALVRERAGRESTPLSKDQSPAENRGPSHQSFSSRCVGGR